MIGRGEFLRRLAAQKNPGAPPAADQGQGPPPTSFGSSTPANAYSQPPQQPQQQRQFTAAVQHQSTTKSNFLPAFNDYSNFRQNNVK